MRPVAATWLVSLSLMCGAAAGQQTQLPDAPGYVAQSNGTPSVMPPLHQAFSDIAIENGRVPAPHFHWKSALLESFAFLAINHAYLAHTDYRYITSDGGVPFNHFWRDYKISLSTWANSGWDDGDPFLDNYVGHPIEGALTGFIQVQNDPGGEKLEFSSSKAYWKSRFKAFLWSAAYSTQFELGPMGEMTVEKYGTFGGWMQNGKWITGEGQVDLVMTPVGGLGWMLMEDLLDKQVARRIEGSTRNRFWVNFTRCAVNPVRGGANILHRRWPWYRASRDAGGVYFSQHSIP